MPSFQIVEAKPWHVGQMARILRHEHMALLKSMDIDCHRELKCVFDDSAFRRAWLADGRLLAVGGVTGTLASTTGYIWLTLAEEATRHRRAIVREARRQLGEIMRTRRELATTVLPGDAAARRLATYLGFHASDTDDGRSRHRVDAALDVPGPHCTPAAGGSTVYALGYH